MARRLVMLSVLVVALASSSWLGRSTVEAAPKAPPPAACKADLVRVRQELADAREAVRRAEAGEAAARAELEAMRAAERARIKRLEAQTGVAAEKLQ